MLDETINFRNVQAYKQKYKKFHAFWIFTLFFSMHPFLLFFEIFAYSLTKDPFEMSDDLLI